MYCLFPLFTSLSCALHLSRDQCRGGGVIKVPFHGCHRPGDMAMYMHQVLARIAFNAILFTCCAISDNTCYSPARLFICFVLPLEDLETQQASSFIFAAGFICFAQTKAVPVLHHGLFPSVMNKKLQCGFLSRVQENTNIFKPRPIPRGKEKCDATIGLNMGLENGKFWG